jgi:RNA polymerase sigma-70 factor (ECF subfamily)
VSISSDSLRLSGPCLVPERSAPPPPSLAEEELVSRAQLGERAALHEIFRRHSDAVYRRLAHLVGPVAEREDLLQQVFSELYRGLHRFRSEARLASYLYRIATNIALDHLKRRGRRRFVGCEALERCPAAGPTPEAAAIQRERVARVWRCLERIKPKKRIAFLLRVAEGLSVDEIAEQVGARPDAVAKRIQHAQHELAAMLADEDRSRS